MMGGLGNLASLAGAAGSSTASTGLGALGGLGIPSVSIQRQDVALKLKLTPHVTNTGQVRMELEAEISELGGIEPTTNSPITTQRKIKTVVVAGDSQTIVIGGLMGDRKTDSVTKIPLLGDLPVLGALFRSKKVEVDKTNLLLVLTPHIVTNDEDFARIFERKLEERREYAKFMSDRANKFRATMNWQRKVGPFGRLDRDLTRHLESSENGGGGEGDEEVIGADVTPSVEDAVTSEAEAKVEAPAAAKAEPQATTKPSAKASTEAKPSDAKAAAKKD
jgi:general secretion pathway protein D